MTKIIMHGCNGKMGQVISRLVWEDPTTEMVAGIDVFDTINNPYPVFNFPKECDIDADVIIDFSTASAVDSLLEYVKVKKTPLILCTTGLSEEQMAKVKKYSKETSIFHSANMSLGVNLLIGLAKRATEILSDSNFDIEIIEKHHNQKIDAPSGTALAIAGRTAGPVRPAFQDAADAEFGTVRALNCLRLRETRSASFRRIH